MPSDVTGELVGALRDELAGLRTDIAAYAAKSRRDRRIVRTLAVSVVFDIVLSAGLYVGLRKADNAAREAGRASSTNVVNCVSGNESRRIQAELWNTVLQFPPPAGETAEAKTQREAQTARFKDYIAKAFEQKDCSKVG